VKVVLTVVPRKAALTVTVVLVATAVVAIVKVAVVAPAGTVTVDGSVPLVLLEVRPTTSPPVGAAPNRVTVPVVDVPPVTDAGATATLFRYGVIVSEAVTLVLPEAAVMTAVVLEVTAVVVMVKVAEVAPAATVTNGGTEADALLLINSTSAPPAGAAWVRVTVPVDVNPPTTEVGFRVSVLTGTVLT
jgi:hypothetical protein